MSIDMRIDQVYSVNYFGLRFSTHVLFRAWKSSISSIFDQTLPVEFGITLPELIFPPVGAKLMAVQVPRGSVGVIGAPPLRVIRLMRASQPV